MGLRQAAPRLRKIRRLEPSLRALGVGAALLFGSVARDETGDFSDIDIALRPASAAGIAPLTLISIHGVLGDEFGHGAPIDVVVLPCKNPDLNAAIEREGVLAFS